MTEPRSPGWYPDPDSAGRFRAWSGARWGRVTSNVPVWGPVGPDEALPHRTRRRPILVVVGVVVVLAVAVAALVSRDAGHDGGERAAAPSTTSAATATEDRTGADEPSRSDDGAGQDADGTGSTTQDDATSGGSSRSPRTDGGANEGSDQNDPGGSNDDGGDGSTAPGSGTAPLVPPEVDASCEVTPAQLATALSTPEVQRVVGDASFSNVRCSPGWASARSISGLIAVVQRIGAGWVLVALGDDQPCLELEVPDEVAAALGC